MAFGLSEVVYFINTAGEEGGVFRSKRDLSNLTSKTYYMPSRYQSVGQVGPKN